MTELAIPAGKLENAIVAYRHGADAVYFGLKEFSARKGAGNFSEEDLSKISRLAAELGRKYYITINTLIDDSKLQVLYETLKMISKYKPDGLIVQDLGIANIIKKDFPELPLHGSTQLAVHTVNGVRELQKIGFTRAVLSRELSLDEIRKIREACPDIELKVFIHGALCYGFSGICMASYIITGRSANEGECAQICRTYFRDGTTGKDIFPFSLCDMEAGKLAAKLQEIGIDSLKVEGRLKGNKYVAATTDYYRAILDGKDEKKFEHPLAVAFRRKPSAGYLEYAGPGHRILTTGSYTGHLGEKIGITVHSDKSTIHVETDCTLNDRDGLMILLSDGPYKFPAKIIRRISVGYIISNTDGKTIPLNSELYRISDSALNEKLPSLTIPLRKEDLTLNIIITDNGIIISSPILTEKYSIHIEEGRSGRYEDAIRKAFSQSGESAFNTSVGTIENTSSFICPYINPSDLKHIRREYLASVKPQSDRREYKPRSDDFPTDILPDRKLIDDGLLPWNLKGIEINGYTYFSFPPVTFNEDRLFAEMESAIAGKDNARIGLNNIAQLAFAEKHQNAEYFADIYLYLSNRESAELLRERIPNLVGGYLWLERSEYIRPWPFTPTLVNGYTPPLFISRACYRHDGLGLDCRGCSRNHEFSLSQNRIEYKAYVNECVTVIRKAES